MRVNACHVVALALLTAGCPKPPQPAMQELSPEKYQVFGDLGTFGEGAVRAVDTRARFIDIDVRRPSRVFIFAIDRENHLHAMARCWAEPGNQRIQPTLSTVRGVAMNPSGRAPQVEQWTWRPGNDALLIVLIDEEPREAKRACDNSGDGRSAGTMTANEALERLALSLKRYPGSPWASYLVEP